MKLIIEVTEDYYEFIKNSTLKSVSDITILDGKPYEERPQGEWIVGEYMDCHSDILPKYTCPFCGEVAYRKYDFCHCGADMRGKENE